MQNPYVGGIHLTLSQSMALAEWADDDYPESGPAWVAVCEVARYVREGLDREARFRQRHERMRRP